MSAPLSIAWSIISGVTSRVTKTFEDKYFPYYVCKWVRPNHVQTDEHWTKNWKKAELYNGN